MPDSLEKISERLDTTFVPAQEDIQETSVALLNTFDSLSQKKNELVKSKTTGLEVLNDEVELREGLKNIITKAELVMEKLEQDIKIGSKPYTHKVYGELLKSVTEAYRELREVDTAIFKAKVEANKIMSPKDVPQGGKITMNAEQLLDLVNKARETSTMKEIKADFVIEDK